MYVGRPLCFTTVPLFTRPLISWTGEQRPIKTVSEVRSRLSWGKIHSDTVPTSPLNFTEGQRCDSMKPIYLLISNGVHAASAEAHGSITLFLALHNYDAIRLLRRYSRKGWINIIHVHTYIKYIYGTTHNSCIETASLKISQWIWYKRLEKTSCPCLTSWIQFSRSQNCAEYSQKKLLHVILLWYTLYAVCVHMKGLRLRGVWNAGNGERCSRAHEQLQFPWIQSTSVLGERHTTIM